MSFGQAVAEGFSKYATFSGRSRRSAYWYWVLFSILAATVAAVADTGFGTTIEGANVGGTTGVGWISLVVALLLAIPGIAVTIRRLHDTGRSGWWWLLSLVCGIGAIIVFVFCLQDSRADNEYGPNPKAVRS